MKRARRFHRLSWAASLLLLATAALNLVHPLAARAGDPLYPDLRTRDPRNLVFDTEKLADGQTHYVLRFDNTIENHGGRFEIVMDPTKSRDIYQNVYDAEVGGNLVLTRRVTADLIYHPTHNHFHLTDVARYALYKKSADGTYRQTTRKGSKTSFCILDSVKVLPNATSSPSYTQCTKTRQGLSAGWGDLYAAGLPDQWVDLGIRPLGDGDYALHSTVDPFNRIAETDDGNNTGVTLFSVRNGKITGAGAQTAYCAAKPATVTAGTTLYVSCQELPAGAVYGIRWQDSTSDPVATATAGENGELEASFTVPPSPRGAHFVLFDGGSGDPSLLAVVDVAQTFTLDDPSGNVGDNVGWTITGFGPNETVTLAYQVSSTVRKTLRTVTTDATGRASGVLTIPSSVGGEHKFLAIPPRGTTLSAPYVVLPSLRLTPSSVAAGGSVLPSLRGYGSREQVTIKLVETNRVVRRFYVSSTGAASSTSFVVPSDLAPGLYTITATGRSSGLVSEAPLRVTALRGASVAASSTAAPSQTATATAVPTPPGTPAPTPTPTPSAPPSPTETPPPDVTTPEPTVAPAPTEVPAPAPTDQAPGADGTPAP